MKILTMLAVSALSLCALAEIDAPRTLAECNAEIKELNAERLALEKNIVVRYRKRDHPTANVEKRTKLVEINREYVQPANAELRSMHRFGRKLKAIENAQKDREEWEKYNAMIPECEKRLARIAEIKARIAEINAEKSALLKRRK